MIAGHSMAGSKLVTRALLRLAPAVCLVALVAACGSSATAPPSADQISGSRSCPAAETQDLTFTGAITGHVSCSTSTALCSTTAATPSLTFPLNARIGSTAVQLLLAFRFFRDGMKQDQAGTYIAGKLGDAPDSSSYGASLDGAGHWETPTPGGEMTLSTDDASGAAGSVQIKLSDSVKTFTVSGTWRCVKRAGASTP